MADPDPALGLAERITTFLQGQGDPETVTEALVHVCARWVAVRALALDEPVGRTWAMFATPVHVAAVAAHARMGAGWRDRN